MRNASPNFANYVVRTLEVCLFFVLACSAAVALDSDRTIAQFAHTAWGPKDGAPSVIRALAQSADGYLWLGCPDGLYRFDGVAFERYKPASGGPLPAQDVHSLLSLPNGDLWIGFRAGAISLLRNGHATNYTARDGVPAEVWSLAQDQEGTIWAATNSGLARLERNRWKKVGKDWNFPGESAFTVFLDHQGILWVSTQDTLVFLPPGARKFQPTGIRIFQVPQIAQAANGKLWMAETTRSVRPIPVADKRLPPDETEIQVGSQAILFDNDGALWITSVGDGLRRAPAPELLRGRIKEFSTAVESFTARDGLSDDVALTIFQDREGNIWVGTNNGLDRFRKTSLVPVVLPFKPNQTVLVAGDVGDAWVEDLNFLMRVHGGRAAREQRLATQAMSAYRDPSGAIWWFCADAIHRNEAGKYATVALPPSLPRPYWGASAVATEDGSGALWLSAEREGLFYLEKGGWHRLESASEFAKLPPRAAFTDWMGRAWFGYEGGTIVLLKDEGIQRAFPANDSPVGNVRAINGRGRHMWVGGELGLAFFDGNHFRRIIPADAETFRSVLGVEEARDGSLWLAESRGVIQVPASEVRQALDNPSYRVKYRLFDSFDGLPGTFAGTSTNQTEIQGTDGRLWFAASGGIVWIDPANISTNSVPPPVLIRSVKANGRLSDSLANLVLPPRTTNLQIGYTALSLSVPEKVRFRYLLEGVDKEWQDAGTRREAIYTRLGPGDYHFRVIACNNDGIWNEEGARLGFNIAPAWFQTAWFLAFSVCIFLLLLWALYRLRLRQLARQFKVTLETRVDERTRIARELHDTLLQSFQGLTLQFQRGRNLLPGRTSEAIQTLDAALDGAEQAIVEGRDAIHDLRSATAAPKALVEEIRALGEELVAKGTDQKGSVEFRIVTEGSSRSLRPNLQTEMFRIVREALRNAFSHSQGRLIETELAYTEVLFRIRIRDNGKGIDPDQRLQAERRGHWGLRGMRERTQHLGGELEVWSEPGAGTEIELRIPAAIAYETVSSKNGLWRFWRRKGSQ
jgi:signal transduction histidine kinase/ligand-binding sensor domain-containing protein